MVSRLFNYRTIRGPRRVLDCVRIQHKSNASCLRSCCIFAFRATKARVPATISKWLPMTTPLQLGRADPERPQQAAIACSLARLTSSVTVTVRIDSFCGELRKESCASTNASLADTTTDSALVRALTATLAEWFFTPLLHRSRVLDGGGAPKISTVNFAAFFNRRSQPTSLFFAFARRGIGRILAAAQTSENC